MSESREKASALGKIAGIFKILLMILFPVIGILFVVYFWNLDQKVLTQLYKFVNQVFDEKEVDINF